MPCIASNAPTHSVRTTNTYYPHCQCKRTQSRCAITTNKRMRKDMRHTRDRPYCLSLQEVPILGTYSAHPFQAALDSFHRRKLECPTQEWQALAPSAMRPPMATKQGTAELLQAFNVVPFSTGESALERLLGGSVPTARLSVEAAAAFPALARGFAGASTASPT